MKMLEGMNIYIYLKRTVNATESNRAITTNDIRTNPVVLIAVVPWARNTNTDHFYYIWWHWEFSGK